MTTMQPQSPGLYPGLLRPPSGFDGGEPGKTGLSATQPVQSPCSSAQQQAWMLDRLDPGSAALNVSARWQLDGRVSVTDLGRVFELLVARHPMLRTRLLEQDGEPVQQLEPRLPFHVSSIDLSGLGAAEAEAEALSLAQLEAATAFDLTVLPLLRVTHLQIRAQRSVLLLTAHQAICDAASLEVLARELGSAYVALHAGQAARLPELPLSYAEHLAWQRQQYPELVLRRDEAYWKRRLQDLKYFELAPDHPRPPLRGTEADSRWLLLDRQGSEALRELAARCGSSLHLIALATLLSLLNRYSGESDIAIGSQLDGRGELALENLVGPCAHTLLVRADLSGDPLFQELLTTLRSRMHEDRDHATTPVERLVEVLQPRRDLSRSPLYSISFGCQSAPARSDHGGSFHLLDLPPCAGGIGCDLQIRMSERPEGWRLSCDYNRALFEAATIERLLQHFRNLLQAVGLDPARRLSALPMLDEAERQRLVVDCNPPQTDYPHKSSVPELVSAQARRTPLAIAVSCGDHSLSYRELDAAANRLAQWLRLRGVQPGDQVGVCLDRGLQLPVALLAVLKAGAAYVPLDPAYPATRLAQIVEDAKPAAIVCSQALRASLPASTALIVAVDTDAAEIGRQPATAPDWRARPDSLAYVIFTSGSTGRPKGVQIPHRALVNFLWAMRSQPGLLASDRLLAVTTVSFDIAALELFLPLIVGAQVVIAQAEEVGDGNALLRLLRTHRITVMQATPVTWQILLAAGWQGDPPLKMLCGGEALSRRLADQLLAQGGELWNLYGPTETTVWSSALRVQPGLDAVPIGPPIANTQFYVMDAQAQILPLGVPGELYIGGDGVALGYLHRPELSAERFVEDRVRHQPGARLYRTGDRVRLRVPGSLEFLGRADQQIKLRGFRIELGEIESALRAQAEVAEAIAMLLPDAAGEPVLKSWVVPHSAPAAPELASRLRASLRQSLPVYMCPNSITVLDAWPRMPNGKVDRTALPRDAALPATERPAHAPGNATEQRLARIWRDDLQLGWDSIDDNFFEIGGHSLLAVRLLARIEAEFGQRLSLATLFRNPSIAEQARVLVEGDIQAFDFQQVLRLQPLGSRTPLIAINNTGIFYSLSKRLGPDQPFTSLQLFDPALPQLALPTTLEEIASGYARLIRQVQPEGPYALLGWCVAGTLAFEVACQLRAAGQEVSQLILFDTQAPGHLQRLPWLRRLLAEVSHRWQLIRADWTRAKRARHRLATFLENRGTVQKLKRWLGRRVDAPAPVLATPVLSPHQYDQWLLRFLEDCAAAYQPQRYPGAMLLFSSSQQPTGRFIDPQMGWGGFVAGGVEVVVIGGDHFNIFREPGVSQMASRIEAAQLRTSI